MVEIIVLIVVLLGAVRGFRQGFVIEVFSLVAFFLGLLIALEFTIPISVRLFGSTSFYDFGAIAIFIALFVLLSMAINALARGIKKIVDVAFLGAADSVLGAFAGALKSAFVLSILVWVFESVGFDVYDYTSDAYFFSYIVGIGPAFFEWMANLIPIIRDLLDAMNNLPEAPTEIAGLLPGKIEIIG